MRLVAMLSKRTDRGVGVGDHPQVQLGVGPQGRVVDGAGKQVNYFVFVRACPSPIRKGGSMCMCMCMCVCVCV